MIKTERQTEEITALRYMANKQKGLPAGTLAWGRDP